MNPKIIKKHEERQKLLEKLEDFRCKAKQAEADLHEKNETKIAEMEDKLANINEELTSLENTDIIGLVRAQNLTLEELAALLDKHNSPIIKPTKEEGHEE